MTDAILFHNIRGSGREIRLALGEIGVELLSVAGESIAVWPYGAIERASKAFPDGLELRLGRNETETLQVFDEGIAKAILAKSPKARRGGFALFEKNVVHFRSFVFLLIALVLIGSAWLWDWLSRFFAAF